MLGKERAGVLLMEGSLGRDASVRALERAVHEWWNCAAEETTSATVQGPHRTPEEEVRRRVRERGKQLYTHRVWLPVFAHLVLLGALHILSSV